PPFVCEVERVRDYGNDIDGAIDIDLSGTRDFGGERAAFDEFHREVVPRAVTAGIVEGHDVRVQQRSGGLRLALEESRARTGHRGRLFRRGHRIGGEHLQRDDPPDGRILRAIDHAHRALSDLGDDLVTAELAYFGTAHRARSA